MSHATLNLNVNIKAEAVITSKPTAGDKARSKLKGGRNQFLYMQEMRNMQDTFLIAD